VEFLFLDCQSFSQNMWRIIKHGRPFVKYSYCLILVWGMWATGWSSWIKLADSFVHCGVSVGSEKLLLPQKHELLPRNSVKVHAFFACPCHIASQDIPKCQGCALASILRAFSDLEWRDTSSYEGKLSGAWLQFVWCLSPCKLKWSTAACLPFQHST